MLSALKGLFNPASQFAEKFDPYLLYPEAERILDLLKTGNFVAFEREYKSLKATQKSVILGQGQELDLAQLEAWEKAGLSYLAKLFLGAKYMQMAGEARGSSIAANLSEDQVDGLIFYADKAQDKLLEALDLEKNDAFVYAEMISRAMVLGDDRDYIHELFDRGYSADPTNKVLLSTMLLASTRKWGGSREELLEFQNKYLQGTEFFGLKLMVLAEDLMDNRMMDEDDEDFIAYNEKLSQYRELFTKDVGEYARAHPEIDLSSASAYSNLAFVWFLLQEKQKSLELVKKIGNRLQRGLWGYTAAKGPRDIFKVVTRR